MGFQISPGVNVSEIDLTTIIPAVSTTTGAFAGHFTWGPVGQRVLVDSEETLVKNFFHSNSNTGPDFFTAANFLAYGNSLYVVRVINQSGVANTAGRNAIANGANYSTPVLVKNEDDYNLNYDNTGGIPEAGQWTAKYPGSMANGVRVSVCPSATAFEESLTATSVTATSMAIAVSNNASNVSFLVTKTGASLAAANTAAAASASSLRGKLTVGDIILLGPDKIAVKINAIGNTTSVATGNSTAGVGTSKFQVTLQSKYVSNSVSSSTVTRRWEYYDYFPSAPGTSDSVAAHGGSNDEMHVVVIDGRGSFSGIANTVVEIFPTLSKASGTKSEDGTNVYYKEYMNKNSRYVWWTKHLNGITNIGRSYTAALNFGTGTGNDKPANATLSNGFDGALPREADFINGYNLFKSSEDVDVSLILGGRSTSTRAIHIINNIVERRKDCIAVFSPRRADVVGNSGYSGSEVDDIVAFRNLLPSTSYAVLDSGWKYQYDKYTDVFRYVPCNGDTAGTMVRTDIERDPWYSPAGYNRGQIKNVIKLAFNPNKAERDQLYKNGINPITTFPGEGTILFGDKTLLTKPSAFDRINVRRLFIVLEKAIATAAKYTLFEFNDAFTRAQFKALVEPFLRDVQGRRGITDFRVVCDETNNTPEVIDRNEFIGDIYIKPARSINFIQLNFVAVRTGVDFTEIVGKF